MATETTEVTPTPKPKRRVLRFLLRGALALLVTAIVVGTVAHFIWKYSASDGWQKIGSRKGVTVYALKVPGSSIKKFRAVWTVHSHLAPFVAWASDDHGDTMHKNAGLNHLRILGRRGEQVTWSAYRQPIVEFLDIREWVIRTEFSQNPSSHALVYTVNGVPDMIPPDNCCVRIPVMNNRWTLTPIKNGAVQVEWYCDMDLGGNVPYVLQNTVMPQGMLNFAPKVEGFIQRDKYKNAKYSWIQEQL